MANEKRLNAHKINIREGSLNIVSREAGVCPLWIFRRCLYLGTCIGVREINGKLMGWYILLYRVFYIEMRGRKIECCNENTLTIKEIRSSARE